MSRFTVPLTALAVAWLAAPAKAQVLAPEPMPMGWASLYGPPAVLPYYGAAYSPVWGTHPSWGFWPGWGPTVAGYWNGWVPFGYGLVWRPAHDGGSYPAWWSGPAVVLAPPPVVVAAAPAVVPAAGVTLVREPLTADQLYDRGYAAYWAGDYAGAVRYLSAATAAGDDPRAWSYLALTYAARGNRGAAAEAAKTAAALEFHRPGITGESLERVQGPARAVLTAGRREVPDPATARTVLAARTPRPAVVAMAGRAE
jgi:hypothetical protein